MDKFRLLTYRYMRIFTVVNVLLVAAATCLQAAPSRAQALEKRVSASFSNISLHEAVLDLQRRSGTEFAFLGKLGLDDLSVKKVDFTNERLSVILKTLMARHRITFFERDGTIFLTEAQQQRSISGRVTDLRGEALNGATVMVKGEDSQLTTTDNEGRYNLAVNGKTGILVVSFMGYRTKEVPIASRTAIDILLEPDLQSLEEVVVVGYGTQKKENLTGSISSLRGEELINRPIMRASAALQGLASGLTVTQQSGRPGADDGTLRIRGIGTLGDASPLVLIDGIEGAIDGVDPNDIAAISVLKDAASASIYGSRAANGVILVTTKQGKGEDLQVNYNNFVGWQRFTELPEYTDGYTYMVKLNEAYENMGREPLYSETYLSEYLECKGTDRMDFQTFVPGSASIDNPKSTFSLPWLHTYTSSRTNDYNNDGRSEPAFFKEGNWIIAEQANRTFGDNPTDIPVPADYDGDGKTEIAIFRKGTTSNRWIRPGCRRRYFWSAR